MSRRTPSSINPHNIPSDDDDWQTRPFEPNWVVHPGETLKDAILERGWTDTYTALRLGWSIDDLRALLGGHVRITSKTAPLLGIVFETSSQFWLNLQQNYDQDCKRLGIDVHPA